MKILHIITLSDHKFMPSFIDFVLENFDKKEHKFIVFGRENETNLKIFGKRPVEYVWYKNKIFKILWDLYTADKIIIHGLWGSENVYRLFLMNFWILKKCYWVAWGGDFYFPEIQSEIKKKVIRKVGNVVSYLNGDYEYIIKNYGSRAKFCECIMYPSNVFREVGRRRTNKFINILIGNSATQTNKHFEVFEKLYSFKKENIRIYVPLSYGDFNYRNNVIETGKKLFGNKFIPLIEFMKFEDYLNFLNDIDIAIFANNRQQGMGNLIQLLGMGKKVYLRRETSQWMLFEKLGVKIFDFDKEIDLKPLDEYSSKNNYEIIKNYFSMKNLRKQWKNIFYA